MIRNRQRKIRRSHLAFLALTLCAASTPAQAFSERDLLNGLARGLGTVLSDVVTPTKQHRAPEANTRNGAQLSKSEARQVQLRLNEMGFDAGPADGKFGRKTIQAVTAYQRSKGYKATGRLTTEQIEVLLQTNGNTDPSSTQLSAGNFRKLHGFDLPMNDYRSGLQDSSLRNISIDACEQQCSSDDRCLAYTYETTKSVCFLKNGVSDPLAFATAISGQRLENKSEQFPAVSNEVASSAPTSASSTAEPPSSSSEQLPPLSLSEQQKFEKIGLRIWEGAVLNENVPGTRDDATEILTKLLLLKVYPDSINNREHTGYFATILPASKTQKYLSEFNAWLGDDQFSREENRLEFLRLYRDEIFSLIPELPFAVVEVNNVSFGQYNFEEGDVSIDIGSADDRIGDVPIVGPKRLKLDVDTARRIIPSTDFRIEGRKFPASALRYVVRDVRPTNPERLLVSFDTVVIDLKLYSDRNLTEYLMDLPLGDGTITTKPESVSEFEGPRKPVLDGTYAYLLAANEDASLLDSETFIQRAFTMRREEEASVVRRNQSSGTLNFGLSLPTVLLQNEGMQPSSAELQAFHTWFRKRADEVSEEFELASDLMREPVTSLLRAVASGLPEDAREMMRERYPSSPGFGSLAAGRNLDVFYSLAPSLLWQDEAILNGLKGQDTSARLIVRVVDRKLITGLDKSTLVLEIEPKALSLKKQGQAPSTVELSPKDEPPVRSESDGSLPVSRFSVLGLTLGMPVSEAQTTLLSALEGYKVTPLTLAPSSGGAPSPCDVVESRASRNIEAIGYEIEHQKKLAARERFSSEEDFKAQLLESEKAIKLLEERADALRLEFETDLKSAGCRSAEQEPMTFAFAFEVEHTSDLKETIVVYRVGSLIGPPVVSAVYRRFTNDTVGTLLSDGLPQAYGSDFISLSTVSFEAIWPDDVLASGRFTGDERCTTFWRGDASYPDGNLDVDCGAYLRASAWRMVLIDTRFTSRVLRQEAEAAQKEIKKPEIKF